MVGPGGGGSPSGEVKGMSRAEFSASFGQVASGLVEVAEADVEAGKVGGARAKKSAKEVVMGLMVAFQAGLEPYRQFCGRYCCKLRPWAEFARLALPTNDLRQRLSANPVHYRINHEAIFLLLVGVVDDKGAAMILVLALVWMVFVPRNSDTNWKVRLGSLELGPWLRWVLLAAASAAVLWMLGSPLISGFKKASLAWLFIVAVHSVLHPIPDGFSGASLKELLPEWTYAGAEHALCSGACLELPCLDCQSPNLSGCCCMPLIYDEVNCSFEFFFEEVLSRLHTGDIFLSSWPSKPGEWAETGRCLQRTRWTHVGMVYRPSDCLTVLTSRDRIFNDQVHESRPMIMHMLVCGEMGFRDGHGFELVDLETWVKDFLDKHSHCADPESEGQFLAGVRLLQGVERGEAFCSKVQAKVDEFWHRPYELQDITKAGFDLCECIPNLCPTEMKSDTNSLFCSEMVAEVYKATGLLKASVNGSELIPKNFDTTSYLWLQHGASLSQEYVLCSAAGTKEREARGYKNRGNPDPVSSRFGPAGFWGVDPSKQLASSQGLPPVPSAMSAPAQLAMAPSTGAGERPPGEGTGMQEPLLGSAAG
mmetsp:Transcript_113883/g.317089  ORF Transcript_113883/g.317089 Transcript_113883/m.317089 type:complete len:592 (-) Transcript_113883:72-1847(-)|eukprot:CAMPEP_0179013636 /NCGR_PEP_ID=MMETSP0796-20121207/1832_1 /TAXON_ID=73915 /ORGANISM="Pyrodinium bahamense, Strain pbaha01" /LENGTH=591 /DNA_ID=CAMNT_0020709153 /DNA_START=14 /DNA_END=1789 /DNA_ORIENTATION=-